MDELYRFCAEPNSPWGCAREVLTLEDRRRVLALLGACLIADATLTLAMVFIIG